MFALVSFAALCISSSAANSSDRPLYIPAPERISFERTVYMFPLEELQLTQEEPRQLVFEGFFNHPLKRSNVWLTLKDDTKTKMPFSTTTLSFTKQGDCSSMAQYTEAHSCPKSDNLVDIRDESNGFEVHFISGSTETDQTTLFIPYGCSVTLTHARRTTQMTISPSLRREHDQPTCPLLRGIPFKG